MRKGIGILLLLCLALVPTLISAHQSADTTSDFVTVEGTEFILNDQPFYYAGTNNYYFMYKSELMIDDVLENAAAMGLKVIRTWGFMDGNSHDGYVMQPKPGIYDEDGFAQFDYAVWKAKQLGIRFVVPLVNYWNDFGGMQQYADWFGLENKEEFYTDERAKQAYKNYVEHFINRTNPYTGLQYKDEPTIMSWQLANEPRNPLDTSGDTLLAWADEMSAFIKSIAPNQLVSIGDEGFYNDGPSAPYERSGYEGVDWLRLIELDNVDYATFHMYPDHWGTAGQAEEWGNEWIRDHVRDAHAAGKPVVLEEFGLQHQGIRDGVYASWYNTLYEEGANGSHFWILTGIEDHGGLYPDYDGFRVVYPSSTADVIAAHAALMNSIVPPNAPPSAPNGLEAKAGNGSVTLSWQQTQGARTYNVKRSEMDGGPYETIADGISGTTYTDTGLSNDKIYFYVVSAENSFGESENSVQVSAVPADTPPSGPSGDLQVLYRNDGLHPYGNHIRPHFRILNDGDEAVDLSNVTMRYWYTKEGTAAETLHCDWAEISCSNVHGHFQALNPPVNGADHYLEIGFDSIVLEAGKHTGNIQLRFNKHDWSNYDETDDYSYIGEQNMYAPSAKVTLYFNGELIWGEEPR